MTGETRRAGPSAGSAEPPVAALRHPLRVALLDLFTRHGTLTSTQAARELGQSTGACSFHLRQLQRFGRVEEVPGDWGRARPWRLTQPAPGSDDKFAILARELEDEGYHRWLAGRDTAPPDWHDEAFSAVLHLTPDQLAEVGAAIRAVTATFDPPATPPPTGALPVGLVVRLFPLLPASADD